MADDGPAPATLKITPASPAEAPYLALAFVPTSEGQKTAQREIVVALENAFDARDASSANRRSVW
jgi:hypothetical protein